MWTYTLQKTPDSARTASNLGLYFWQNWQINLGLKYLKLATELNPEFEDFRYKYANTLITAGRIPDSINQFLGLIANSTNKTKSCNTVGDIYLKAKQTKPAKFFYETTLKYQYNQHSVEKLYQINK